MSDHTTPDVGPDDQNEPGEGAPPPVAAPAPRASYSRREHLRAARLDVGGVIGKTFSIWMGNLLPFTALALLIYSPVLIIGYVFLEGMPNQEEVQRFDIIMTLAERVFFASLLAGTVVYGVVMQLRGNRGSLGSCLSIGLSRLFHVFAVSFLQGVLSFIWFVPGFIMVLGDGLGLGVLFLVLAIIPMIIVILTCYVSVPAIVVERIGVIEALFRSAALTKGSRMTIFGIVFIFVLLVGLMTLPVVLVIGFAMMELSPSMAYLLQTLITVLLAPLTAIIPAVIYHDLRIGKEGVDVKDLAAVFD